MKGCWMDWSLDGTKAHSISGKGEFLTTINHRIPPEIFEDATKTAPDISEDAQALHLDFCKEKYYKD